MAFDRVGAMHFLLTILFITTTILAPVAIGIAWITALVLQRLWAWWAARPLATAVAAVLIGYLCALCLVSLTPAGRLWPWTQVGGLYSLADACGLARGTRLWMERLEDPKFGICGLCDDAPYPGDRAYRPEYRRIYCP
jgi:hypothetical protein